MFKVEEMEKAFMSIDKTIFAINMPFNKEN